MDDGNEMKGRVSGRAHLKGEILTGDVAMSLKCACVMTQTLKPNVTEATTKIARSPSTVNRSHTLSFLMFLSNHVQPETPSKFFETLGSHIRLHFTALTLASTGRSADMSRSLMTPLVVVLPYSSESLSLGEALARKNKSAPQDDGQGHVARAVTSLRKALHTAKQNQRPNQSQIIDTECTGP